MVTRARLNAPMAVAESEDDVARLKFNEPLSWRAGKPIPVADLQRRLKALSKELRELEQETFDRESLADVAKDLATSNLLAHKDQGVRAYTACCLADILRLCAPDAPYTASQLKEIFSLFVKGVLPALSDPSNAYNSQHLYVLHSLATVKSIVLLTDIPSSRALTLQLFATSFDMLSGTSKASSGEELTKNVEYHLTAILATMVDECPVLPTEVIDIMLAQFLRADPRTVASATTKSKNVAPKTITDERQSTLTLKQLPPAYNMAKNVCNSCPNKMSGHISHYFSSLITDASATSRNGTPKRKAHRRTSSDGDTSEGSSHPGPAEKDLKELYKAHRLLRELWKSSPMVLQNVIPQLEAELAAEDIHLRVLATETMGDMISGIGAAGPPTASPLNPSVYLALNIDNYAQSREPYDALTTPSSPQSFSQTHSTAYQSYLSRRNDRSPLVRAAWTTGIGRILASSAGGVGLSFHEVEELTRRLADMFEDSDEKVRLAAVNALEIFSLDDIVNKVGSVGGIADTSSVLHKLAERMRDPKHSVRKQAMSLLGRIWGAAAGEMLKGNNTVNMLLGPIPSKIFDTFFINNIEVNASIDHTIHESLLPLGFPLIKTKSTAAANGDHGPVRESQFSASTDSIVMDADKIRAKRLILLVKCLDQRGKLAFFNLQTRQVQLAKYVHAFLARCEEHNGGVTAKTASSQLRTLIDYLAKTLPDTTRAAEDLMKFAKLHDRRSYQLLRFCMAPESDYKKVYKAIKELTKRIEDALGTNASVMETLRILVFRSSNLLCNKSHVPPIMDISQTDEDSLGGAAQEMLKEISARNPDILKAHIQELCRVAQEQAPSADKPTGPAAAETLKACAAFARRYPNEIPKDRKFAQSMVNYALQGLPCRAAKYGVSILLASADRRAMYAKMVLSQCLKDFEYGNPNFLSRLAALSQLILLAPTEAEVEFDAIIRIAIDQVLLKTRRLAEDDDADWEDPPDEECEAKSWALKILVNQLRSLEEDNTVDQIAGRVYKLLHTLVTQNGELSCTKNSPKPHKTRLRLVAAKLWLKLCSQKRFDGMLKAESFQDLAAVAQDPLFDVREQFLRCLEKLLNQNKLSQRFTVIVFLLAFEPRDTLRQSTTRWLRSRCHQLAKVKNTAMERLFARFLHLLAHHPDFGTSHKELLDFTRYIVFYLNCVANEQNISLIYHMAQRVKSVKDAVRPEQSENLYILSDLSQAVIRKFETSKAWSIETLPTKMALPSDIFAPLSNHDAAQSIAMKQYLPEELLESIDEVLQFNKRPKKRKSDSKHQGGRKRAKSSANHVKTDSAPARKAAHTASHKAKSRASRDPDAVPSSERRRSGRQPGQKSYAEQNDSDDDAEMHMWEEAADDEQEDGADSEIVIVSPNGSNKENHVNDRKNTTGAGEAATNGKMARTKRSRRQKSASESDLSAPPGSDDEG